MTASCSRNDLINQRIAWVLWGVPMGLFVVGVFLDPLVRTLLWTPALLVAGGACVVNALHCRRLHCYLTGPLFLAAAGVTVLRGFEIISLPWVWIGAAVVGGTVLVHLPEWIRGKYGTAQCATDKSQ